VLRRKMLDEDERELTVGRQCTQQLSEGFESACGRTNTNNRRRHFADVVARCVIGQVGESRWRDVGRSAGSRLCLS
jgi:hypothetical protein